MMADALVRELNKLGYQPVFLPRTGVTPPELYNTDQGRLIRRGPLVDKLPTGTSFVLSKGSLADIEHVESSSKSLEGATSFLARALQCLGIPEAPQINLSFAGGSKLTFKFSGVTYVAVDPVKIDGILKGLDTKAIPVEYIEAGKLHIAYDYAYAQSLTMERSDGQSFETDIKGRVGEFIDLGATAKAEVKRNTVISFTSTGKERAAFAYKAGQLVKLKSGWAFKPEVVRLSATRGPDAKSSAAKDRRPFIVARGVVLAVKDQP